ncbi:MAG TPA: protein kinase [Kofleriaceae bacterium]|nr:protein kinase [Kofleriaceae bacterium]
MSNQDDPTVANTPRGTAKRALTEPPQPDRYTIVKLLGEGGMGRVYRAHDTRLGRDVAIKMIDVGLQGPDKTQQRERFVREAKAAARLVHPNIAVVHDVDAEAGWLVMELVEGEALREVLAKGPLEAPLVRKVAEQVLAALDAAHGAGIIHRDVKPSNIVLQPNGNVKLVDFGVARLIDMEVTRTGENVGTPAYMAPEQIRGGAIDGRTDLYALGATLYELVTGARMIAFESPGPQAQDKIEKACGSDRALAQVIVRCLQSDPEARFASARDALTVLEPARPKKRALWPLAMVAFAALAGGGVFALAKMRMPKQKAADARLAKAFTLAQRGENEKASGLLAEVLADDPLDPDAVTYKLLVDWWEGGILGDVERRVEKVKLSKPQRAMITGIDLITKRRETEAIAFLEGADRESPNSVEILYALGEARWHGQQLQPGVDTLTRAFMLDPRWQVALHHVTEFRLSRGEATQLQPIAEKLRVVDPPAGATLDCKIAVGNRDYKGAADIAAKALERLEKIPELYICLAQAYVLERHFDLAEQTAKAAFDLWPIDMREWGGFAQYAELTLYRGQLDEYLALLRGKPSRQRAIALLLWRPKEETNETQPSGPGMRMPPLGAAVWVLQELTRGRNPVAVYGDYVEPEVAAYGKALRAELQGDLVQATAEYRKALAVPAKGDMRMLLAHHLARVLAKTGHEADAKQLCEEEVIAPRMYLPYRAVVLPDCLLWAGRGSELLDQWRGFEHPAVVKARAAGK